MDELRIPEWLQRYKERFAKSPTPLQLEALHSDQDALDSLSYAMKSVRDAHPDEDIGLRPGSGPYCWGSNTRCKNCTCSNARLVPFVALKEQVSAPSSELVPGAKWDWADYAAAYGGHDPAMEKREKLAPVPFAFKRGDRVVVARSPSAPNWNGPMWVQQMDASLGKVHTVVAATEAAVLLDNNCEYLSDWLDPYEIKAPDPYEIEVHWRYRPGEAAKALPAPPRLVNLAPSPKAPLIANIPMPLPNRPCAHCGEHPKDPHKTWCRDFRPAKPAETPASLAALVPDAKAVFARLACKRAV